MRVDYVNGHDEFDGALWFVDGKYAGHESQVDVTQLVPPGETRMIQFFHRELKPDLSREDYETLINVRNLRTAEKYLERTKLTAPGLDLGV